MSIIWKQREGQDDELTTVGKVLRKLVGEPQESRKIKVCPQCGQCVWAWSSVCPHCNYRGDWGWMK